MRPHTAFRPGSGASVATSATASAAAGMAAARPGSGSPSRSPTLKPIQRRKSIFEPHNMFARFDRDNDGVIGPQDIRDLLTDCGVVFTDRDIDSMMEVANVGGTPGLILDDLEMLVRICDRMQKSTAAMHIST
jgi:hypothetical protein